MDTYICMAESLRHSPATTLLIGYTLIQNLKKMGLRYVKIISNDSITGSDLESEIYIRKIQNKRQTFHCNI